MDVSLQRADGTELRCVQEGSEGPGVLLLHAWWGLNKDIGDLARRLGEQGLQVLAPDLFDGRVATTVAEAEKLVASADGDWERTLADTRIALGYLGRVAERVGVTGLSFGAAYAVALATVEPVDAVVLFYGSTGLEPTDVVAAPVLGHFADDDPYEPDGGAGLLAQLRAGGTAAEFHRYPGTYHWFFEPSNEHYDEEAAALAWTRTVGFLKRVLAS